MGINFSNPKKALNTVFYKLPALESEIQNLSKNLGIYIHSAKDGESEEYHKGKIEFVDVDEFFKKCSVEKQEQTKHVRIVLQGLSGINEKQRLKAVLIPKDMILANSANFLKYQTNYPLKLLLALFNSKLLNFIFKATSTSSNVNGYEVDALPLPPLPDFQKVMQNCKRISFLWQTKSSPQKKQTVPPTQRSLNTK